MQIDGAYGGRGGRGGSRGRNSGPPPSGPHRTNSGGFSRPAPYTRVPSSASETVTKWSHDLFDTKSNDQHPRVNLHVVSSRLGEPVASLPAMRPAPVAAAPAHLAPVAQPTATGPDNAGLANRLGIRGKSNEAEQERLRRERQQSAAARREEELRRIEAEKEYHRVKKLSEEESNGFVVQVEGLVWGTSAEDVQTAFGQYGETTYCFIVNETTATEEDDLIARLVFERKRDAESACQKLHGAIADGRPLKVQITPGTPMPPPPSTSTLPSASSALSGSSASVPAPLRTTPTGPRNGAGPRALLPTAPRAQAPPARTMYADSLGSAPDTSGMDIDMDDSSTPPSGTPTGPRRGGQNGARGSGRGGRGRGAAPAVPSGPPSILSRISGGPQSGARGGGAPKKNSLLARLA